MWTGYIWRRLRTSCRLLWTRWLICGLQKDKDCLDQLTGCEILENNLAHGIYLLIKETLTLLMNLTQKKNGKKIGGNDLVIC